MITIIPIYWMFVVSTRSPVELFEKPDLRRFENMLLHIGNPVENDILHYIVLYSTI